MWCQYIHSSAATPPAVACLCSAIDTWAAGNAAAYPWNMEYAGHFSDAAGGALYGDLCCAAYLMFRILERAAMRKAPLIYTDAVKHMKKNPLSFGLFFI